MCMPRKRVHPPLPYQKTIIAICLIGALICLALIVSGCRIGNEFLGAVSATEADAASVLSSY